MEENRSCSEFKSQEPGLIVNCANCKRWNYKAYKCREMIWAKEWIHHKGQEQRLVELLGEFFW